VALTAGTRLGAYKITAQIGAGGMGEVWCATDTDLGRQVAIKILPDAFAQDPDRLARFEREAKTLASLNHPNIAIIHGLEKADGIRALVMELVEGPTLADRIGQGPIPIDEALPIAKQIAEALEAAHEQGLIHRDLKPANIKVRADGTVKLLDFGLAKAMEPMRATSPSASMSATITTPAMTQAGLILGTAAYMSPEQAKGRPADKRSDIWAFGCLLYEMLTGKRAFEGDDVADTLAAVIRGEPDWTALPSDLSPTLLSLVKRCLQKDRRERIGDIAAALFALQEPRIVSASPRTAPVSRNRAASMLIVACAVGLLTSALWWAFRPPISRPTVARLAITLPEDQRLAPTAARILTISPDGSNVAYLANRTLYVRPMSGGEAKAIPIVGFDSAFAPFNPAFSPAGDSIVFYSSADRTLKKVAVTGGAAVTLCSVNTVFGISWDVDGILFGRDHEIMRVSPDGGEPSVLVSARPDELAAFPQMLPDGDSLLFTLTSVADERAMWDQARIVVQSLKTGERTTLVDGGSQSRYLPTGHILYGVGGVLYARAYDLKRKVIGEQMPVVVGIRRGAGQGAPFSSRIPAAMQFSVSDNGSLVYVSGSASVSSFRMQFVLSDRGGSLTPLKLAPGAYQYPRVSPTTNQIVFGTADGKEEAVWTYDLAGPTLPRRLTFKGQNRYPVWSSDGRWVAFQSDRDGSRAVFRQRLDDNTGTAERLTTPEEGTSHAPEAWSGDTLLFSATKGSEASLHILSVSDRKTSQFSDVKTSRWPNAAFSKDGRWVAYAAIGANQTRESVYVEPFPPTGVKHLISTGDAHFPVWSRNELFYLDAELGDQGVGLVAVPLSNKPEFPLAGDQRMIPRPFNVTGGGIGRSRTYDVMPDGQQFIGIVDESQLEAGQVASRIEVVLNWHEELKRLVPTR
jgi:eukaryotic-like serine/threonine-protein kinase